MLGLASKVKRSCQRRCEPTNANGCTPAFIYPCRNIGFSLSHSYEFVRGDLSIAEDGIVPVSPDQGASRANVGQVGALDLSHEKMICTATTATLIDSHKGIRIDTGHND